MIEDFLLRIYLFLSSVIEDLGCVKKLNKLNLRSEKNAEHRGMTQVSCANLEYSWFRGLIEEFANKNVMYVGKTMP
jgi:hypothetical protein